MKKVLTSSDRFLMSGGRWLTREEPEPPPPPPVTRYVYLNQTTGGTISASPMSGVDGDTVTLSNTPDTNYTFDGYSVNGATLYSGNKFDFSGSDVTCSASWTYVQPSLQPYTIRLRFTDGVTPTFSKGTLTRVSTSPNVWDLTYVNENWQLLVERQAELLEVIDANVTGVRYLQMVFEYCPKLYNVNLFDTSNCTDFRALFRSCVSLTSIPLFNTSNATNLDGMLEGCTGLQSVPLFNTSKAITMRNFLRDCTNLTSVPLFDTSKATSLGGMFYNCTSLTTVPLFNTSSCTSMDSMFHSCTSLKTIPLFNTSSCTDMDQMFMSCINVESGSRALYRQAAHQAHVPTHDRTFKYCGENTPSGRTELGLIPSSWK